MFWTKDPAPLLPWLDELDGMGYRYLFQFTLTPTGRRSNRACGTSGPLWRPFRSWAAAWGGAGAVAVRPHSVHRRHRPRLARGPVPQAL
ncbi:DUF1848 family protein [Flavonifractor plautii]|nr:DUF1848 family protein [Flavonifractor plautii]